MPDTKSGRERKGRNKRRQLESRLASRDAETEFDDELPEPDAADAEYLVDPDGGDGTES
ncbi:hypothetical protein B4589_007460 [Halolamina sp. CBA1230]|uniref:hypothetical protein n=1 Tax=Halolamina sp. CBA1230 TaxID=1853690 RepID=UPI001593812E|nr:hypothetical protein [Halolamina sp. CBA1230]QKY20221.1 hypothetical protein B4589_007460 [Halolamina sp. CBA1230]